MNKTKITVFYTNLLIPSYFHWSFKLLVLPIVRHLTVYTSDRLSLKSFIKNMKTYCFHLLTIYRIHQCLTTEAAKILVHGLVVSCLNYCSILLAGFIRPLFTISFVFRILLFILFWIFLILSLHVFIVSCYNGWEFDKDTGTNLCC